MIASEPQGSDIGHPDASYATSYYQGYNGPEGDAADFSVPHEEAQETSNGDQQSIEHLQNEYYARGLEEIDSLQLLDLSPLATWKLSSHKQGHGLDQLREDNANTYWQSDGSLDGTPDPGVNGESAHHKPHSIMLQFSKKVSLERILLFCNYNIDESYTPLKIRIMAGSSSWDLTEVCVVSFDKPVGWSHIIFQGVRGDGLLKCFVVKIIILANHQDGKDSHVRAIRCFGKKAVFGASKYPLPTADSSNMSLISHSGQVHSMEYLGHVDESLAEDKDAVSDPVTEKVLNNVANVIGFNTGFETLPLQSVSGIR